MKGAINIAALILAGAVPLAWATWYYPPYSGMPRSHSDLVNRLGRRQREVALYRSRAMARQAIQDGYPCNPIGDIKNRAVTFDRPVDLHGNIDNARISLIGYAVIRIDHAGCEWPHTVSVKDSTFWMGDFPALIP